MKPLRCLLLPLLMLGIMLPPLWGCYRGGSTLAFKEEKRSYSGGSGGSGSVNVPAGVLKGNENIQVVDGEEIAHEINASYLNMVPGITPVGGAIYVTINGEVDHDLMHMMTVTSALDPAAVAGLDQDDYNMVVFCKVKNGDKKSTLSLIPRTAITRHGSAIDYPLQGEGVYQPVLLAAKPDETVPTYDLAFAPLKKLEADAYGKGAWLSVEADKDAAERIHFAGNLMGFRIKKCAVLIDADMAPPYDFRFIIGETADYTYQSTVARDYFGRFLCENGDGTVTNLSGWSNQVSTLPNRPPVFSDQKERTVKADATLIFSLEANDPDGNALTYACSSACPDGLKVNAATGRVYWTPTVKQLGTYAVSFTATDGKYTDKTQVSITVTASATIPELVAPGQQTAFSGCLFTTTLQLTAETGDGTVFSCADGCPSGFTIDQNHGTIYWVPSVSQLGDVAVTLKVQNDAGSSQVSLPIKVYRGLDAQPQITAENTALTFSLASQLSDAPNVQYQCIKNCPHGLVVAANSGQVTWTPGYDQAGHNQVVFGITTGTVTGSYPLAIVVVDDPPTPSYLQPTAMAPSLLTMQDDYLLALAPLTGMRPFTVTPTADLVEITGADLASLTHATTTVKDGRYLYVATGNAAGPLVIVDLAIPRQLSVVATLPAFGDGATVNHLALARAGSLVYASTTNGLKVISVVNPLSPSLGASLGAGGTIWGAAVADSHGWMLSDASRSLVPLDLTDPAHPAAAAVGVSVLSNARQVLVSGNYLYLISPVYPSLAVYALDTPDAPAKAGEYLYQGSGPAWNRGMIKGDYGYFYQSGSSHLVALNLAEKKSIALAGEIDTFGPITDALVASPKIYATGAYGLTVISKLAGLEGDCPYGSALKFDGASAYVEVPNAPRFEVSHGAISVAAWVRWANDPATWTAAASPAMNAVQIIAKNPAGGWALKHTAGNTKFVWAVTTDGGSASVTAPTAIQADTWYLVVGVYDSAKIKLYIDGTLAAEGALSGNLVPDSENIYMGGAPAANVSFPGWLDDAYLWSSALTASEVAELYSAADPASAAANFGNYRSASTLLAHWALGDGASLATIAESVAGATGKGYNFGSALSRCRRSYDSEQRR